MYSAENQVFAAEFVLSTANQVFAAEFVLSAESRVRCRIVLSVPNQVFAAEFVLSAVNQVFAAEFMLNLCCLQRIRCSLPNCVVRSEVAFAVKSVLAAAN